MAEPEAPAGATTTVVRQSTGMNPGAAAAAGTAGSAGSAGVIAYFWNWWAVREWGAPPMDAATATNIAIMLFPVFTGISIIVHYIWSFRPMPPVRERRIP